MREKVQCRQDLNYVPNALARSLITLQTHTVGLVVRYLQRILATVARSVENVGKKSGYRVLCVIPMGILARERLLTGIF